MRLMLFNFHVGLFVLFNLHGAAAQCAHRPSVTVTGRLLCYGESIPFSLLSFVHKIGFLRNTIDIAKTSDDGSFEVKGVPHFVSDGMQPELYLQLQYWQNSTSANFWMAERDEIHLEYSGADMHMGDIDLTSDICRGYVSFYAASTDFSSRVGEVNPQVIVLREPSAPIDTPYVKHNVVRFLPGYEWTVDAAKHEVAHVTRHVYDGDDDHFYADMIEYRSEELVIHDCDTDSNAGFAFNEGWAWYWQGACMDSNAEGALTIEGNVAAALRALQKRCCSSDAQMWQVLKDNPGAIHTFEEYESHHAKICECP